MYVINCFKTHSANFEMRPGTDNNRTIVGTAVICGPGSNNMMNTVTECSSEEHNE